MMPDQIFLVKTKLEHDIASLDDAELASRFRRFPNDRRTLRFLDYYNRTVLDKEPIRFGEFKRTWALQGMKKEFFSYFDDHFDRLKKEILEQKDIKGFFEKYCCTHRREGSFCSKLFHTLLPAEFPPVDNPIRKHFGLQNEDFIDSVLVLRDGYNLFIREHPDFFRRLRRILAAEEFAYLRVDELSDLRILDMYYWFLLSRKEKTSPK